MIDAKGLLFIGGLGAGAYYFLTRNGEEETSLFGGGGVQNFKGAIAGSEDTGNKTNLSGERGAVYNFPAITIKEESLMEDQTKKQSKSTSRISNLSTPSFGGSFVSGQSDIGGTKSIVSQRPSGALQKETFSSSGEFISGMSLVPPQSTPKKQPLAPKLSFTGLFQRIGRLF